MKSCQRCWQKLGQSLPNPGELSGGAHDGKPSLISFHSRKSENLHIMATSSYRQMLYRASQGVLRPNGSQSAFCTARRRGFADVAGNDMTLPLKGYKVLDMTRVLAGVRFFFFWELR